MKIFLLALCMVLFFVSASLIAVGGINHMQVTFTNWIQYSQAPSWIVNGWISPRL